MKNIIARRNRFDRPKTAAATIAAFLVCLAVTHAQVIMSDSFATTGRIDGTTGLPIGVIGGSNHPELAGVRVETGSTAAWEAPSGHQLPTWTWGGSEQVFANTDATGKAVDALLPFSAPSTPFALSLDVFPNSGGGSLSIGYSTDQNALNDNFSSAGQVWLTISGLVGAGSPATWTLHRSGQPDATGSAGTLPNDWVPLILTYDPQIHKVSGSANGISIGTFDFTAAGIQAVAFESKLSANNPGLVQVDNFAVSAVPEPRVYALITALGLLGLAGWSRCQFRASKV